MGKKFYLFLMVFILSSNFLVFTSLTSIQSENITHKEIKPSLKSSSFEDFRRIIGEFRANYYTTNDQRYPSICALSNDTIAVAWESNYQDGPDWGVYARVFNATTGNNITREFRVNYYTTNDQANPSICALSSDKFAVAWESYNQDGSEWSVYARVFNAKTGNNITREFRVNNEKTNDQRYPSICALSDATIAVAWESYNQDGSGYGVYARVFDANTGNNITREFRVNYYTTNDQRYPSICALSSNKFAVAWEGEGQGDTQGVYARVFNAITGNNITREFRINYDAGSGQYNPSICALSNNKFAVAWKSWDLNPTITYNIHSNIFNANTVNNITREFLVNSYIQNIQEYPSISALSNDTIAVAWDSDLQDGDYQGVYARIFNATTGNGITQEVQINYCTAGTQNYPSICTLSNDTIAVAWQSSNQDGSNYGVYISIFGPLKISAGVGGDDDDDDDDNGKSSSILDKILNFIKTPIGIGVVVGTIIVLIAICIIIKKR